jgi:predicted PhzF superfamily epimerase YddE/YHI9
MADAGVPLYLVDAFASGPFTGNPAAVCLVDGTPDAAWMQRVGGELNQAATSFVGPPANGWRRLRWFTSTTELTLCGHGTLATAHVLWERGESSDALMFETAGGRLTAHREGDRVGLRFPSLAPVATEVPEHLPAALEGITPRWVGRNDLDLFVEVAAEAEVRGVHPDLGLIGRIDARCVVVTAASDDSAFSFVSRCFAPRIGIPEDQATGSVHCGLGPLLGRTPGAGRRDRRPALRPGRGDRGPAGPARRGVPGGPRRHRGGGCPWSAPRSRWAPAAGHAQLPSGQGGRSCEGRAQQIHPAPRSRGDRSRRARPA